MPILPLDGEQASGVLRLRPGRQVPRPAGPEAGGGSAAAKGGLEAGSLGTTTDFVSPPEGETGSDQHECGKGNAPCCRRRRRFQTRRIIWSITGVKRLSACGRVMASDANGKRDRVVLKIRDGIAFAAGVCVCANTWLCPVCSAKIRAGRANEIAEGLAKLITKGGSAWMVTFTVRHTKKDELAKLIDALSEAFRRLGNGKAAIREKKVTGKIGTINSKELTYGKNGWHPHLHVIVCFDGEPDIEEFAYMIKRWEKIWLSWTAKYGHAADAKHGVKWEKVFDPSGAGEYASKAQDGMHKIAAEVARGDLKKGKLGSLTPFELIEYMEMTGDAVVLSLWAEYEAAIRGKSPIRWSPGLKALLGVGEVDDQKYAGEEVAGAVEVAELGEAAWKMVVMHGLEVAVLEAIERGGFRALVKLLTAHQIWAIKRLTSDEEAKAEGVGEDFRPELSA